MELFEEDGVIERAMDSLFLLVGLVIVVIALALLAIPQTIAWLREKYHHEILHRNNP